MTPRDIDTSVERAVSRRTVWSRAKASVVANEFVDANRDLAVDWDDDAGETWIRLMRKDIPVAYLSVLVPIVFSTVLRQWPGEVEAINVADLAGTELACAPDLLRTAFGTFEAEGFNPDVFTANALWYATV